MKGTIYEKTVISTALGFRTCCLYEHDKSHLEHGLMTAMIESVSGALMYLSPQIGMKMDLQ